MPQGSKKNDIYVCAVSDAHHTAATGRWIAIVSTQLDGPDAAKELALGLKLFVFLFCVVSSVLLLFLLPRLLSSWTYCAPTHR